MRVHRCLIWFGSLLRSVAMLKNDVVSHMFACRRFALIDQCSSHRLIIKLSLQLHTTRPRGTVLEMARHRAVDVRATAKFVPAPLPKSLRRPRVSGNRQ